MTCKNGKCKQCDKCLKKKKKNEPAKKVDSKNIKPDFVWKKI